MFQCQFASPTASQRWNCCCIEVRNLSDVCTTLSQMNLQEVVEENYRLVGTLVPPQHSVLLQSRISSRSIHRLTQGISSVTWTYKCRLRGLRASPFQHPWGVGPSQLILFLQSQYPESQHLAQDLTKLLLVSSGLKTEPSAAPCPPTSPSTSSCSPACSPSHTGWMTQKLCDSLEKYTPVLLRMSGLMQSHQGAFALPCSSPTTTTWAWSSWSGCAELQVT